MNRFCLFLLLKITLYEVTVAQESTTAVASIIARTSINVTDAINLNNTESNLNVTMTRITQPSSNIERFSDAKQEIIKNITTSKSDFKPSPQLETYIEYNKYPVVPAYPEAKHLYSQFTYIPPTQQPAEDKKGYLGMTQATIKEESKENSDKYFYNPPTTEKTTASAQDKQSYPSGYEKPVRSDSDFPSFKYYERFNYAGPTAPATSFPSFPSIPSLEWYNKVLYPTKSSPIPVAEHPYPFVTDLVKKEPVYNFPKSMMEYNKMTPWKRAAKIFAAILPIGLLISALTPNILTIAPVNGTSTLQCRKLAGRAEKLGINKNLIEKWSKPGCEARLLCETAIREDNMDVETVKKLFWSFVSQNAEDSETPEELEAVSNAIKEKKCNKIPCRHSKKESRDNI